MIHVEVTYALPEKQRLICLDVPEGTTMLEAARLSGIDEQFADLELGKAPWGCSARWWRTRRGIYSRRVNGWRSTAR